MTAEALQIKPCANIATALKNILKQIESGEIDCSNMTIVAGTEIFHIGEIDDMRAVEQAIWNMTYGIQKLMFQTVKNDV